MSLRPKKVTPEVIKSIFGNKLHRNMCVRLNSVLVGKDACPGVYQIQGKKITEGGFGQVYRVCCENKCDYVGKWTPSILIDPSVNKKDEYTVQDKLSQYGLTPHVREVWECLKGTFIVMDTLEQTLDEFLTMLSPVQMEYLNAIVIPLREKKLLDTPPITEINYIQYYYMITDVYNDLRKQCPDLPPFNIPPDPPQVMKDKKKAIVSCEEILRKIKDLGYAHGDSHSMNFMKDKTGKWFAIDFGFVKHKPNYKSDLEMLHGDIMNYDVEHLKYLVNK